MQVLPEWGKKHATKEGKNKQKKVWEGYDKEPQTCHWLNFCQERTEVFFFLVDYH